MLGTVVGVLRGGPSREHEVSLATGRAIAAGLPSDRFSVRDIYIDKQGVWHERGRPVEPERVLATVDVVLIGLHGEYGEDGEVQKLLERYGVPYAGSDHLGSHLAMHKVLAKEKAKESGLATPRYLLIESPEAAEKAALEITRTLPQPVVVKPLNWGSSVGVHIVGGYLPVYEAITQLFDAGAGSVLVEEYIRGKEATVGVIENLRGERLYALPPVEIIPPEGDFFSYEGKYFGTSQAVCPARFPHGVRENLARSARTAHEMLGLRHYSRSDFIVSPHGIYYLETNSLPSLGSHTVFTRGTDAIGMSCTDFLSHLISETLG